MNRIIDNIKIGTVGELLVQLRLLEHNIHAAPPLKDSGNDLIAIKGKSFRAIQVKTTARGNFKRPESSRLFHILAVVHLDYDVNMVHLDSSSIFLIPRDQIAAVSTRIKDLEAFRMTPDHVKKLFEASSPPTLGSKKGATK